MTNNILPTLIALSDAFQSSLARTVATRHLAAAGPKPVIPVRIDQHGSGVKGPAFLRNRIRRRRRNESD